MDRLEELRWSFARQVTESVGASNERLLKAFGTTPRERFLGSGPWHLFGRSGYEQAPSDDPSVLYQDITIALKLEGHINNGQPTLHAACIAALEVQEGETIVHIGAGTGYYTAILAKMTTSVGCVHAYEIDLELAQRAAENLAELAQVVVHPCSGTEGRLPDCDIVYVSAGATTPRRWLDTLRPGGRLLFPLTADRGGGGMLLVTRAAGDRFAARFVCGAAFIHCTGARDDATALRLADAFKRGHLEDVRSLRLDRSPDATCWCAGDGWWLSTAG